MFVLAATESPALTPLSAGTSALVTLLALAMALVAVRARRRSGNRALTLVAIAFFVFAAKNAFSAYNVIAHEQAGWLSVPHDEIELILSLFDLVILVLLFVPFLRRRNASRAAPVMGRS